MPSRTVAITGAHGYLGSRIRARLEADGWHTVALVRRPGAGEDAVRFVLGEPLAAGALAGVDALVHCAYDFGVTSEDGIRARNVQGSRLLLDRATADGVERLLVLSTMSAYAGTTQRYGRAKLEIERLTVARGGIAVRPGLVHGPDPGGMVGALVRLGRSPVVPVIAPRARQFPVHEDDLVRVIAETLGRATWLPEVFGVAQPEPMAFADVLRALLAARGARPRLVPLPWRVLHAALRATEALRIPAPFRADSILGLVRPAPAVPPSAADPHLLASLRRLECAT